MEYKDYVQNLVHKVRFFLNQSTERTRLFSAGVIFIVFCSVLVAFFISAPLARVEPTVITIKEGATLSDVATTFAQKQIVRSGTLLKLAIVFSGKEERVVAGDYSFDGTGNLFSVARRITTGDYGLTPIRVTIPEGSSLVDMAALFGEYFPKFNTQEFLEATRGKEGYLFPDTYVFFPNAEAKEIVQKLERTFVERIKPYAAQIRASDYSLEEIITMASLIEREANTKESREIISGILWKRIEIGMPLQVDVTFDYINGKNTFDLTLDDLAIDSPYNTYRYPGLPPGPIGSPSLESVEAALNPIKTDFLFFLADRNGEVHYSATFDEHKEKKFRYLN